uniref:Putative retrovirus-related pol polyprotein from transposon tnt n=1 Tax=Xenopsylla cheopis TaxID=163159 RepID=A0A6M2DCP7_XENCH
MSSTIKIEPLNESNYDEWKIHMRAILKKNDLWGYVSGEIAKPLTPEKYSEWIINDSKTQSELILHMKGKELKICARLESAKLIWEKLQEIFESRGAARRSMLMKKCVMMKMNEGDDLSEFTEPRSLLFE